VGIVRGDDKSEPGDAAYYNGSRIHRSLTYSSMATPEEVWDYDLASRERILRKRQEISSGHNSADYVTQWLFAPAADGETIPISSFTARMSLPSDDPLYGVAFS